MAFNSQSCALHVYLVNQKTPAFLQQVYNHSKVVTAQGHRSLLIQLQNSEQNKSDGHK